MSSSSNILNFIFNPYGGRLLNFIRFLIFLVLFFSVRYISEIDISSVIIVFVSWLGVWIGSALKNTRLRFFALIILGLVSYFLLELVFRGFYSLPLSSSLLFVLNNIHSSLKLQLLCLSISAISTWLFWTFRVQKVIELAVFGLGLLTLFSAHREYRFDASKTLNKLAWNLEIYPLTTLVLLGVVFSLFSCFYLSISEQAHNKKEVSNTSALGSRRSFIKNLIGAIFITLCFSYIGFKIHADQKTIVEARQQNGVSSETKEGLSPLTFESALGASSQPAGIVRLESDYLENPHSPMLYLREAALSKYNGHELVIADSEYDQDAPLVVPSTSFKNREDTDLLERTPLIQSVYLLAEHKRAFGADYPISFVGLTLPKGTNKFKRGFRVYSMAPTYKLSDLTNYKVGNPKWSAKELAHYTTTHQDPRYSDKAKEIVGDIKNPIEQAQKIVEFFNKNAIYTLKPGHNVPKKEDQTAPFLFGDMRGYCVHFAHASVYLLRSLGIPARIGTGYLSDLSQSKDGHILLRMSDRHAWAEIYINSRGWVPFDVQPEQVEVHAETPVDQSLLEELMGLLEPGEEILPEDIAQTEKALTPETWYKNVKANHIYLLIGLFIILFYLIKFYRLKAYLFLSNPAKTAKASVNAIYQSMRDFGFYRKKGETLSEYLARLKNARMAEPSLIDQIHLSYKYAKNTAYDSAFIRSELTKTLQPLKEKSLIKRIFKFLNPVSFFRK